MTPTQQEKPREQVKSALHKKGFRVQFFWPDVHGIAHQIGTKPLKRVQETPKGEHEVDRTYKQWTLRYARFKNGQLGKINRRPMKLLMRALKFRKCKKKMLNGEHPPKLKKLIQSTKLKRTHYGN